MKQFARIIALSLVVSVIGSAAVAQDWTAPDPDCLGVDPDRDIVGLFEGEAAPWTGQLFTDSAATCEYVRFDLCEGGCNLELRRQAGLRDAEVSSLNEAHAIRLEALEEENDILEDELAEALTEPWYDSVVFKISLGAVGFGIGVAAGYLLNDLLN